MGLLKEQGGCQDRCLGVQYQVVSFQGTPPKPSALVAVHVAVLLSDYLS